MKALAELHIVPEGVGPSLSKPIADCHRILEKAGLNPQLHAFGTNVEGEWEDLCKALRECHETLHQSGAQRVNTALKISTRSDREESLQSRVESVNTVSG